MLRAILRSSYSNNWSSDIVAPLLVALLLGDSLSTSGLWLRGIEAEARFENATALSLYHRAVLQDPSFLPARKHYAGVVGDMYGPDEMLRRIAQLPPPPPLFGVAQQDPVGHMLSVRAHELASIGDSKGAIKLLESVGPILQHPRDRIRVFVDLISILNHAGEHRRAAHFEHALRSAIERDRRPAVRYWYLTITFPKSAVDSVSLQAARIACRAGAFTQCGSAYASLSGWYLDKGNPRTAIEHGQRAVDITRRQPSPYFLAAALIRLGRAHMRAGEPERAEAVLREAEQTAEAAGSPYMLAEALHNIAHTFESTGRWEQARHNATRFVNAASVLKDPLRVVSLRDAGLIHWDSGHRAAARDFFERMVRLIDETKNDFYWAGEYYERAGDLRRAHRYYRRALDIPSDTARVTAGLVRVYLALEERDSAQRMAAIHDRASQTPEEVPLLPEVLASRGSYAEAARIAEQWARRKEQERNITGAANAWLQVAQVRLRNKQLQMARDAGNRAMRLATRANLSEQRTRGLLLLGDVHLESGEVGPAMKVLQRASASARTVGIPQLAAQIYTSLARGYGAQQRTVDGLRAADSALAQLDHMQDRFEDDFDRVRFAAQRNNAYETGLKLVVARNDAPGLATWLQRQKARNRASVPLAEIQRRLHADDVLVDYAVTDSATHALLVTSSAAQIITLKLGRAELRTLVERFRVPTVAHFGRIDWARATFDTRTAHVLYQHLVQPLEGELGTRTRWYIVGDGDLHFIPFDALVTSTRPLQYVIDKHEITYLPANRDVPVVHRYSYKDAVIVRGVAPASAHEEEVVKQRLHARALPNPTERAVSDALGRADIIHFATHAEANLAEPLSSFLKVSPGDGNDGYLHISEIASMQTQAALVFLSACETQHGRVYSGTGVMGLARAFLTAGANSVIATQWPVGASAVDVADVFYRELSRGATPARALRSAKLELRKRNQTKDALHWGAFMLVARASR